MMFLITTILIGAGLGAGWGYFNQCSSGACPLTSTWWRGGIYGAVMGLAFYLISGNRSATAMNSSTDNVKAISENEFDREVLQAGQPVLVDFHAPWCGPCKALAPVVDKVAGQYAGQVKFVKVNVDEAPGLAQRFAIRGVPTLMFFQDGKVVDTLVGLTSEANLGDRLKAVLAPDPGMKPAEIPRPIKS